MKSAAVNRFCKWSRALSVNAAHNWSVCTVSKLRCPIWPRFRIKFSNLQNVQLQSTICKLHRLTNCAH